MSESSESHVRKVGIGPWGILAVILAVVALAAAGFFYFQYQKSQYLLKNPTAAAQAETARLLVAVGKHIELPQNEQPTVATVSDVNKLKNQQFFKNARNGDKVLIYTTAKKAILYDPTLDKIVEVGPVNNSNASGSAQTAIPKQTIAKVVIYNGTTSVGLGAAAEKEITGTVPYVSVTDKTNAQKTDYETTSVVDLTGANGDSAKAIANKLKGSIGTLPSNESKPQDADILVILGKNFTGK